MDIRRNIDSKPYMDLRSYCLIFPEASNGYVRRNIDSESHMDLRSYFLLFPQVSNGYKKDYRQQVLYGSQGLLLSIS